MDEDMYARTGRTMFIIAWLIFFIVLFAFFYLYDNKQSNQIHIQQGQVTIGADSQGHYRMSGEINNYPVKFMLDTGASLVAVPKTIAQNLGLKGRYPIQIQTANGQVTGDLTRLNKLSFGKFILNDVKAVIIPGNDDKTVLMGMNVLKKFHIIQNNDQLIIKR